MTAYDETLFQINALSGQALIDYFVLDTTDLDSDIDVRTSVKGVSHVEVRDGYTVQDDVLSLDPVTGVMSVRKKITGNGPGATDMVIGQRLEIIYDDVYLMVGEVSAVEIGVTPIGYGKCWQDTTYTLTSKESLLYGQAVSWVSLPQETAFVRLVRWGFVLDASSVAAAHQYVIDTVVPAVADAGTSDLLTEARAFTTATGLPLRFSNYTDWTAWRNVSVFDTATVWPDQPLTPVAGLEDGDQWLIATSWADGKPVSAEVAKNDTRLLGGLSSVDVPTALLDIDWQVDISHLDDDPARAVGFTSGQVVGIGNWAAVVSRVSHTFTPKKYFAAIELATVQEM